MREEKPTSQQLAYISSMREHSEFSMPEFKGTTKREASEYIEKFNLVSHESSWSIVNGY